MPDTSPLQRPGRSAASFAGRYDTTVLHAVDKIEAMQRSGGR